MRMLDVEPPSLVRSSHILTTRYRYQSDRPPVRVKRRQSAQNDTSSFRITHHRDIKLLLIMPHSQHLHEPRRVPQLYVDAPLPRCRIHLFTHLPPHFKIALSETLAYVAFSSAKQTCPFVPSPKNRRNSRSDVCIHRVNELRPRGTTPAAAHVPKHNPQGKPQSPTATPRRISQHDVSRPHRHRS